MSPRPIDPPTKQPPPVQPERGILFAHLPATANFALVLKKSLS